MTMLTDGVKVDNDILLFKVAVPPKASVVVVELYISKSAGDYRLQRTTIFRMIYTKDNG